MVLVPGRRALVGRSSSWWLGVVPAFRVPSGPAAREIATREPAARSGRSRSPPVPSGPYGTRHAGCPWCWCSAAVRLSAVTRGCGVVPAFRVSSGPAAREIATREPAARSGRSRSPPVPSGPYGTRHAGCPWCWCPARPCRTETPVFGLSRRDAIQTKGPGGRQSSRARCVTQGSDRYSPSTGASAATSTASPDTVPPAPVSPPASRSAATRPPATKSTISAHSRANDESSSASAA